MMKSNPILPFSRSVMLRCSLQCALIAVPAALHGQTTLIGGATGNGDFQNPNIAAPTQFSSGTITNWASWTEQDTTATDTGIYDSPNAGGSQVAYIQGGGAIRNLTTYTIQVGDIIDYGFTDVLGARSDATIRLIYDDGTGVMVVVPGSDLVGTTATGQNGIVFTRSFTVTPGSAWIGKKLGVGLFTTGNYPEVDNVTLTVSPPPSNLVYWDGTTPAGDPNGGSGTWDVATANWDTALTGGVAATWVQDGTATFGGTFNGLVAVSGAINANRLVFDLANYEVTGSTLTMSGTNPTITTNQNATISATLGNHGFVKNGAGSLTLSGDGSAIAGNIRNATGPLVITSANWGLTSFTADGAAITFNGGGTASVASLTLDNTVQVDNATVLNVGGTISQAGGGGGITTTTTATPGKLTSSTGTLAFQDTLTGQKAIAVGLQDINGSTPLALSLSGPGGSTVGDMSFVANTHSGGTTINKVRFAATNIASFGTGAVNIEDGGQAYLTGVGLYPNNFTIAGPGWPEPAGVLGAIRFDGTGRDVSGSVTVAAAGSRIAGYNGANGTISGALLGSGNLEINAPGVPLMNGTLNLTGSLAGYTGTLTVAAGRVNANSALGGSVVVADGATFSSESTIAGNLTLGSTGGAGASVVVGPATPAALSANNVTVESPVALVFTEAPASGVPVSLLSYSGSLTNNTGVSLTEAFPGVNVFRNSGVIDDAKTLKFTITTENHQGTGATTGFWEVGGADANWNSSDTFFYNGDSVSFGDTGAGTVTLDDLQGTAIRPGAVTFTNTAGNDYLLDGTQGIAGAGGLTLNGTGTVTLIRNHSFTGGTTINAGTLVLDEAVNDGTGVLNGTVTVNSGGTLRVNQTNAFGWNGTANSVQVLNINGGSVHLTSAGDNGWGLVSNMTGGELGNDGNGTSYLSMGGDTVVGAPAINTLATSTTATVSADLGLRTVGAVATPLAITVANGSPEVDLLVSGDILSHNAGTGIRKTGAGAMLLSGTNTYTGVTLVEQGSLGISKLASIPANLAQVTVSPGAAFGGIVGDGHLTDADISAMLATVHWGAGSYLVIDTNGADVTVAADITGNIGILKKGAGVLTLTGNNSYSGGNVIEAGSIASSGGTEIGAVAVSKNGTTVSLNFTATGNVDIYASDTLAAPWTKVGDNVAGPSFEETGVTSTRRFYVIVPAGEVYPAAP